MLAPLCLHMCHVLQVEREEHAGHDKVKPQVGEGKAAAKAGKATPSAKKAAKKGSLAKSAAKVRFSAFHA